MIEYCVAVVDGDARLDQSRRDEQLTNAPGRVTLSRIDTKPGNRFGFSLFEIIIIYIQVT